MGRNSITIELRLAVGCKKCPKPENKAASSSDFEISACGLLSLSTTSKPAGLLQQLQTARELPRDVAE